MYEFLHEYKVNFQCVICSFSWKNWVIRGIFTFVMIGAFCLIVYGGPLAMMATVSILFISIRKIKIIILIISTSIGFSCTSKMFRRNHQHWICGVQNSWIALVSFIIMVLLNYFQLLFLWRKFDGLLWSCHQ